MRPSRVSQASEACKRYKAERRQETPDRERWHVKKRDGPLRGVCIRDDWGVRFGSRAVFARQAAASRLRD